MYPGNLYFYLTSCTSQAYLAAFWCKILKVSVTLGVKAIEEVDHFTYLGSVVDTQGEPEADVTVRFGKGGLPSTLEYL